MDWLHAILLSTHLTCVMDDVFAQSIGGLIYVNDVRRSDKNIKHRDVGVEGTAVGLCATVVVSPIVHQDHK